MDDSGRGAQLLARARLDGLRRGFYSCLTRRADALFELADAVVSGPGRVEDLARLSLASGFTRGHGALYDAVNAGRVDGARLADVLAGLPLEKVPGPDGRPRLVLAVDVSNWLRPDASTSPDRSFCHVHGRGRSAAQIIPGWRYSFVAALTSGASSWTALLDARRLHPDQDETQVTADQLREVIARLTTAGHWVPGDPPVLVVMDSGYDVVRLTWLLRDAPVVLAARLRSDRVLHAPIAPRPAGKVGAPAKHGPRLRMKDVSWLPAQVTTSNDTARYGVATAQAWDRMHTILTHRGGWEQHEGALPVIEGTLIHLSVEHLPGERDPKPVWLWVSATGARPEEIDHYWSMFVRRFDLEHTFRLLKQTLGWTKPRLRDPAAADRWTQLLLVVHAQLRLARPLAADVRLPWHQPLPADRLTPARVRAGFGDLRETLTRPAAAPKPTRPGPGRPPGRKNKRRTPVQHVGKTTTS